MHVVNELDVPILCMGLKDVVVSASPEGILVSDKEQSSYIKPYVNTLDHRVMFAEKSWGSFKVIDIDKASMTIKVTLNAGHQMNYHSHQHRDEVWTVIAGKGKTIVDGMEQNVKAGDVITMSAGCRHTVIAETELKLIEVQLGKAIDVHDKQKFELEYILIPTSISSLHDNKPVYRLHQQSIRRLAFVPPYSVFCSISFRCGGLSIERNQKPLAPEITLAVTHHDRQKQVEVKRSSRVNPHKIRIFSGCPYAVVK